MGVCSSVFTCFEGDWVLEPPGSSWRGLVPHGSSQCLIRMPEVHACSSLSVYLILWGSNVACITLPLIVFPLSLSLFLFHSLTLCFSILCIVLSLWVYVHAQVQTCEYVLYVFISLHNLESRGRCFGLRIYLPKSIQVRWVLRPGSPHFI